MIIVPYSYKSQDDIVVTCDKNNLYYLHQIISLKMSHNLSIKIKLKQNIIYVHKYLMHVI